MKTKNFPVLKTILIILAVIVVGVVMSMGGMVVLHAGMMSVVHFLLGK